MVGPSRIAAATFLVLLAGGCASGKLHRTADEVGKEVGSLMSELTQHRRIEAARMAADAQNVLNRGRLAEVQGSIVETDRTVLAMANEKTALGAWNLMDAQVAVVETAVVRRVTVESADGEALPKPQPLPTELLAALTKDLESLSTAPDWRARLSKLVQYGKSANNTMKSLQEDADKK